MYVVVRTGGQAGQEKRVGWWDGNKIAVVRKFEDRWVE